MVLPGIEAHAENIEGAVDNVCPPHVASQRKYIASQVAEERAARLERRRRRIGLELRNHCVAILQLHHSHRAVSLKGIATAIEVYGLKIDPRHQVHRFRIPLPSSRE